MSRTEKLFAQFHPVSTKEWMDKLAYDLKGDHFDQKLVWKTNEGLEVKPFYRSEDTDKLSYISSQPGIFPFLRGRRKSGNKWLVRQNIDVEDYETSNNKALDVLMKGADSLGFTIKDPDSISEKNISKLLQDIHFEAAEVNFLSNGKAKELIGFLAATLENKGLDLSLIRGSVEADPLGRLLFNGNICIPVESGLDYLGSLVKDASILPNFRAIRINGTNFTNAGTDIVKELAFTLSMANEYMVQLMERNITSDLAASKICFCFGTGSNYFLEIAKLRAARLLWSAIVSAYEPQKEESFIMEIHCITSRWNKTLFDPYVNLLRTQTEAMSAVLGGADSVTVEPFDIIFRQPDDFSERIARNQQLLLKEEAYFDKTADPAGGSYYIENLTSEIAQLSWKLFIEIEELGGFLPAMKKGFIQKMIKGSVDKRKVDIFQKKEILLGTNKYPDLNEKIPANVDYNRLFPPQVENKEYIVEPVKLSRGAEELDKSRISSIDTLKNGIGIGFNKDVLKR
jgi:methylmalonyl-CoA mutase